MGWRELQELAGIPLTEERDGDPGDLVEAKNLSVVPVDKVFATAYRNGRQAVEKDVIQKMRRRHKDDLQFFGALKENFDWHTRNLLADIKNTPHAATELAAEVRDGLVSGRQTESHAKAILRWAGRISYSLGVLGRLDDELEPLGDRLSKQAPEP